MASHAKSFVAVLLATGLVVASINAIGASNADAACESSETGHITTATEVGTVVAAGAGGTESTCDGSAGGAGDDATDQIRDSDLDAICVSTAITEGKDPFEFCDLDQDDVPQLTSGMIYAAFARIPLPPSQLLIQPVNGRTLVNFDTNFYTEPQVLDVTVPLLVWTLDFHIVPSEFGWRFGDGESLVTSDPGAPYPDLDVTHRYLKKGKVAPRVDTTYIATYRINGGPWGDVEDQVTIPGAPVDLEVLTATPTLVGYDRD